MVTGAVIVKFELHRRAVSIDNDDSSQHRAAIPRKNVQQVGLGLGNNIAGTHDDLHRIANVRREVTHRSQTSSVGRGFVCIIGSLSRVAHTPPTNNDHGRSRGVFRGHRQQRTPERRAVSLRY